MIAQCKNCQRFGHTSSNCHLKYRCVKCNLEHDPGKCSKNEKTEQVFCINCKEWGHPASFRGCIVYQQLFRKIKEQREIKRNNSNIKNTENLYDSYIQPNINFSQALKTKNGPTNILPQQIISDSNNRQTILSLQQIHIKIEQFEKFMIQTSKNIQIIMASLDALMQTAPNK